MSRLGKWFGFDTDEICEEGFVALERKNFEEAARAFETCLRKSDSESTVRLARFNLAECYTQMAIADFHRARYEQAQIEIEKSFRFGWPTADRHLWAARIARRLESPQEADYQIERALMISPNHPQALALQAATFYEEGRTDEALASAEILPPDDDARVERFRDAHARGDRRTAVAHLLALATLR
jgi:tetratricopeptide (TPR) repeat protein